MHVSVSWLLLAIIAFSLILPRFSYAPENILATDPVRKTVKIQTSTALGKPLFIDFIHDFCPNGTVILTLGSYSMRFYAFQGANTFSIALTESKGSIIYSYFSASASFQVNYTQLRNGFKITLKGSQQMAGSLGLTFQSQTRIVYEPEGVWLRDSGVQLGFNFSDCKAIVSIGNGLSFNLGTSFNVDPSTVATVTASGQMLMSPQHKTFHDGTQYWCYYRNSSQILAEYSTDGITWGNTPINIVNLTAALTDQEGWISIRYYQYVNTYYVYNAYQKVLGGTVFFRRDTLSGTTLTLGTERTVLAAITGYSFQHVDIEVTTAGTILVAFSRRQTGPPYELTSLVYKSATNDGSGGFSYALGTSIKYGALYPCVSGLARLTDYRAYLIYYCESDRTIKGKIMTSLVELWGSEETVVSGVSQIGVSFTMNCYGDDVYFGFANWVYSAIVDDYTFCPYFAWRNYTSSTWAAAEDLTNSTVPNCLNIQICVNASTGDLWFFSHNGYPLTSGNYTYYYSFRTYATGAWSLNKTRVLLELYMDSYSDFVTQNPVSSRYVGIAYGYTTPGGVTREVRYYVLDLSPPPSGAWHDIATWTQTLVTRQWLNVTTLVETLITRQWMNIATFTETLASRQWVDIASWSESFVTRTWFDVASWNETMETRQWNDVSTWTQDFSARLWHEMATWQQDPIARAWHDTTWLLDLSTLGWHEIALWTASLIIRQWVDIALWTENLGYMTVPYIIPILFLGCLVASIFVMAFTKKKG